MPELPFSVFADFYIKIYLYKNGLGDSMYYVVVLKI